MLVATALTSLTVYCPKWKRKTAAKKGYSDIVYIYMFIDVLKGNHFVYYFVLISCFIFSQLRDSLMRRAQISVYNENTVSLRCSVSILNESIVDENSGFQLRTLALVVMFMLTKENCASNLAHS